ncbi:MAG: hypothetical protein PUF55_08835 [Bacteroidales bacterium]|nr:hypothetical protein [Bacteroidales bacterium]
MKEAASLQTGATTTLLRTPPAAVITDRKKIRSRQQTENTVAEDNSMPLFPLLQYHICTPADTFPHTGEGMKNLLYGQENRVRSGRHSLSHRRFGCLHVQESQSEAARLTILQAKIDYLAGQD